MKKIKVLFVIDGLRAGGKEKQLVEVLKRIDRKQFFIGVATFNRDQFYSEEVRAHTDHFKEIDKDNKLKPFREVKRTIHHFKPDIIHTWDSFSSFYFYWFRSRYKFKLIDGSIRDAGVDKGWEYYFKRFFLKRADMIISNSLSGLKYYRTDGRVIYNSIEPTEIRNRQISSEYNIIKVANFTDYKDHVTFIKAALELVRSKTVDHVFLLGDGPHIDKIRDIVRSVGPLAENRIHFEGKKKNVADYLKKCDAGILCSTKKFGEGVSNAVLEYMAAGILPVATDIGGTSEIIRDGENGFLFKEKDHEALVRIITELKKNKKIRDKIKKNSRETLMSKFSPESNMKNLEKIYTSLI